MEHKHAKSPYTGKDYGAQRLEHDAGYRKILNGTIDIMPYRNLASQGIEISQAAKKIEEIAEDSGYRICEANPVIGQSTKPYFEPRVILIGNVHYQMDDMVSKMFGEFISSGLLKADDSVLGECGCGKVLYDGLGDELDGKIKVLPLDTSHKREGDVFPKAAILPYEWPALVYDTFKRAGIKFDANDSHKHNIECQRLADEETRMKTEARKIGFVNLSEDYKQKFHNCVDAMMLALETRVNEVFGNSIVEKNYELMMRDQTENRESKRIYQVHGHGMLNFGSLQAKLLNHKIPHVALAPKRIEENDRREEADKLFKELEAKYRAD